MKNRRDIMKNRRDIMKNRRDIMNDVIYDEVKIKIRKGDALTSKRGLIFKSVLLEKNYLVHIVEYLGDGGWLMPDGKEVIQEERVN